MAKLTKQELEVLEKEGRILFGEDKKLKQVKPTKIKYVYNATNSVIILSDLRFAIRPRELVDLTYFFDQQTLLKSQSLNIALNAQEGLRVVSPETIDKKDLQKPKSTLDKLEEKVPGGTPEGIEVPLTAENEFMKKKEEIEEKEEKIDKKKTGKRK